MSTGADIAAARIIGADYVYMGTRFLIADEGSASETYKEMLIKSTIEDIVYTDAITGVKANFLLPSLQANHIDLSLLGQRTLDSPKLSDPKAWKHIFSAGHGIATIQERQSIREIIEQLKTEYDQARSLSE
jgi:nitronate monooxygenase